jgi:hypothetical protein
MSDCGFRGFPSEDGLLRLYTERDCAAKNGRWFVHSGECLRPDEGSFSFDCAYLNTDSTAQLYAWRYVIGTVAVVGGLLAIRAAMKSA